MAARATQAVIASLSATNIAYTLATQITVTATVRVSSTVRATAIDLRALVVPQVLARCTQIAIRVFIWSYRVAMPATYPELPGLSYSVIKRPKFFTSVGTSASGREVRYAYAQTPLWEWDLTYPDFLPDFAAPGAATPSDLKTLMGFYLSQSGALGGFLFRDPDDNAVTAQALTPTANGTNVNFNLVRTYGGSDGSGTEPIGYVNTDLTFAAYIDGVAQDPSSYDIITTHPVAQVLRFHAAPTNGAVISVDMSYFYYVRFKEDHLDFEKFMDKLWAQRLITLMSQRG